MNLSRRAEPDGTPHSEEPASSFVGGFLGIEWLNRDLGWLFAVRLLRSIPQGFLGVIVPLYIVALGYDAVDLGILFAVSAIFAAALSTTVGILADRLGRKTMLISISLLMGAGTVVFAFAESFAVIVAAAAVGSVGRGGGAATGGAWGPFYPAAQSLMAEKATNFRRTTVFGAFSFVGVLAGALGALMAGLPQLLEETRGIPEIQGDRMLFMLAGLMSVATALAVLPVHEARSSRLGAPRARSKRTGSDPAAGRASLRFGMSRASWRLVSRFMITNATNGLSIGMLGPFVVYWFYRRFGVGSAELASLFFLMNLAIAVPYLMAGRLAQILGSVRSVVVTRTIAATLLLAAIMMPTFWAAAALYALRTVFNVLSAPVRQSYLMGVIEPSERASAAGFANFPAQATSAAGPYFAGYVMQYISLSLPLGFAAVMQGVNTLLFYIFFHKVYPPEEIEIIAANHAAAKRRGVSPP